MTVFVYNKPNKAVATKQVKDFELGTVNCEKTCPKPGKISPSRPLKDVLRPSNSGALSLFAPTDTPYANAVLQLVNQT